MKTTRKSTTSSHQTSMAARTEFLKKQGLPLAVTWDEDAAIIDAHVTSAVATRLLAPLGSDAIGTFKALPGNMVAVEAIVSHEMAIRMLEAYGSHPN